MNKTQEAEIDELGHPIRNLTDEEIAKMAEQDRVDNSVTPTTTTKA